MVSVIQLGAIVAVSVVLYYQSRLKTPGYYDLEEFSYNVNLDTVFISSRV